MKCLLIFLVTLSLTHLAQAMEKSPLREPESKESKAVYVVPAPAAAAIFVDNTAASGGNGSVELPFRDIQPALDAARRVLLPRPVIINVVATGTVYRGSWQLSRSLLSIIGVSGHGYAQPTFKGVGFDSLFINPDPDAIRGLEIRNLLVNPNPDPIQGYDQ